MNSGCDTGGAAIAARDLVRHFDRGRVHAVDHLNLEITEGEFVAICGPSGCGKSTVLNLIAAIERADAGELRVGGRSVADLSEAQANEHRQSIIGLVFQLHNLLPNLTALENVQVPMLGRTAPAERPPAPSNRVARARRPRRPPARLADDTLRRRTPACRHRAGPGEPAADSARRRAHGGPGLGQR